MRSFKKGRQLSFTHQFLQYCKQIIRRLDYSTGFGEAFLLCVPLLITRRAHSSLEELVSNNRQIIFDLLTRLGPYCSTVRVMF